MTTAPHIQSCFNDHRASCHSDFVAFIFISVILPSPPTNHCSLFSSVAHMAAGTSLTGALPGEGLHEPTLPPAGFWQIFTSYGEASDDKKIIIKKKMFALRRFRDAFALGIFSSVSLQTWTWLGSSLMNLGELKRICTLKMWEIKWIIHPVSADLSL